MKKLIIDKKDGKFVISISPFFENTFVIDEIEISEEAKNALFNGKGSFSIVKEFTKQWREKVYQD